MSERKSVTINYYRLEAAEEIFYHDLDDRLTSLAEGGMDYGFFDGRSSELMFKIFDPIDLSDRKLHFVSLIKEKQFLPVWFNREGLIQEAPLDGGMLGDISYALIDPMKQCVVTFGNMASGFADFARWLTDDQSAGISPVFVNNAYDEVTQWEVYRKINISVEAQAVDFIDSILDSEYGNNFEMLNTLKGLKIDLSVSMGHGKGSLDKELVRQFVKKMLEENYAGKLKVSGKNFDEQSTAEHDLYSAKLKRKTDIVVAGMHVSPDEAKSALFEAYQINIDHIESAVVDFEEE